jgi:hypothetical protein
VSSATRAATSLETFAREHDICVQRAFTGQAVPADLVLVPVYDQFFPGTAALVHAPLYGVSAE